MGPFKGAALQSLVVYRVATRLPEEQLQQGAPLIDENKYIATQRIVALVIGNKTTESIEGLAHVCRLAIDEIAPIFIRTKHQLYLSARVPRLRRQT